MKKQKKIIYILLLIIYPLNVILSLLNYLKDHETFTLVALILWSVATILQIIAFILDLKKK